MRTSVTLASAVRRRASLLVAVCTIVTGVAPAFAQAPVVAAWDANQDGVTVGYTVSVGVTPGAPLVTLDVGAATSVALPLPLGSTYYVAVQGYNSDHIPGPPSAELVVDLSSPPGPPASFNAEVAGARATLSWTPPTFGGAPAAYLISVGTQPGVANLLAGYRVSNALSISGDVPPGVYYAQIQAVNVLGAGAPLTLQFEVGGGYQPLPPSNLRASWNGDQVTLSWNGPVGPPAQMPSSFQLEAGSGPGLLNLAVLNVGGARSFTTPVPPGTYFVRVRGVSARGVSGASNEIVLKR